MLLESEIIKANLRSKITGLDDLGIQTPEIIITAHTVLSAVIGLIENMEEEDLARQFAEYMKERS